MHLEQKECAHSDMALVDLLVEDGCSWSSHTIVWVPTISAVIENYRELRLTINKWACFRLGDSKWEVIMGYSFPEWVSEWAPRGVGFLNVCLLLGYSSLQCCVTFCCTAECIRYVCTYIPSLLNLPPDSRFHRLPRPNQVVTGHQAELSALCSSHRVF